MYPANFLKVKEFEELKAPTDKKGLIAAWRDAPDLVLFDPALADISDREFIYEQCTDRLICITALVALSSDPASTDIAPIISKRPLQIW